MSPVLLVPTNTGLDWDYPAAKALLKESPCVQLAHA